MNHFLRHHNIKCLDTKPLYKNHIYYAFWAPGDEKPHFKFAKYCQKSCRQTSGSHLHPFSSIKNLQLKKGVFFFLLPIRIRILNHLKWIFSNIFAFWILFKHIPNILCLKDDIFIRRLRHDFWLFKKGLNGLYINPKCKNIWDGSIYVYL